MKRNQIGLLLFLLSSFAISRNGLAKAPLEMGDHHWSGSNSWSQTGTFEDDLVCEGTADLANVQAGNLVVQNRLILESENLIAPPISTSPPAPLTISAPLVLLQCEDTVHCGVSKILDVEGSPQLGQKVTFVNVTLRGTAGPIKFYDRDALSPSSNMLLVNSSGGAIANLEIRSYQSLTFVYTGNYWMVVSSPG